MKKQMVFVSLMILSSQSIAAGFGTMARVVSSEPVFVDQWVLESIPTRHCEVERHPRLTSDEARVGRLILGGLIGSAIGREVSDSSRAGTVGAIVGGAIASQPRYESKRVCYETYRSQHVRVSTLSHYDVTVTHRGRLLTVQKKYPASIGSLVSINQANTRSHFRY